MSEIDAYIAELASRLHGSRRDQTRIPAEVRSHLDDAIGHRQQAGAERERAVADALGALGTPSLLATRLNALAGTRAMRRGPIVAFTAGLAVFAGFVVAVAAQPRTAVPRNAAIATQVVFWVAMLAFQVAFAAGACAASRALALSRIRLARGEDRQFVLRCATISTYALSVAALGLTAATGLALNRLAHRNALALVLGGAVMVGVACAAVAAIHRMQVNSSINPSNLQDAAGGLLGLGERAIALVRRHPITSCGTTAAVAALLAMSHAETSFSGALPLGLTEAAAVVLGFVVLGPPLGLRNPRAA